MIFLYLSLSLSLSLFVSFRFFFLSILLGFVAAWWFLCSSTMNTCFETTRMTVCNHGPSPPWWITGDYPRPQRWKYVYFSLSFFLSLSLSFFLSLSLSLSSFHIFFQFPGPFPTSSILFFLTVCRCQSPRTPSQSNRPGKRRRNRYRNICMYEET